MLTETERLFKAMKEAIKGDDLSITVRLEEEGIHRSWVFSLRWFNGAEHLMSVTVRIPYVLIERSETEVVDLLIVEFTKKINDQKENQNVTRMD